MTIRHKRLLLMIARGYGRCLESLVPQATFKAVAAAGWTMRWHGQLQLTDAGYEALGYERLLTTNNDGEGVDKLFMWRPKKDFDFLQFI